ncbi:uncharacterized protein si:dkeyp-97a10.3 isoform X2 [Neoarius graeffei]|uniref:uncharacterized protein si:dkeyp-97a10.3 isoform X2 n=1 Tax=Neoarius graeffei TaxID=443677 RepID=UPI00298BCC0F|nr:uncharacterized protein si:dkeyp-97a10.3 isoform X2 [Neoarius graeffei]
MNVLLCPFVVIIFSALPLTSCQDLVPIQFQSSPVQVATGKNAVFTVQTISNIFSITWLAPRGDTLGQWINNQAVINPIAQYLDRVSISATQLTIRSSQLSDAGNYTVTVTPFATTGLATNSLSVALLVYEGGNATLTCSWTSGTNTSVTWGKDSTNLPSDSRFFIDAGSLNINPVNRNDAGEYSCTVSNPISSQTATASLTVYYGPDTPEVKSSSSNCVGGGDATIGQTVQLTCTSVSLPPALLSWQFKGVPLTTSQANGGTLNLQIFSNNQSGQYTCSARNSITTKTSQQQTTLNVVDTCLSGGAVAGIVIACFVALVLIIVAIVLILRQRNVNQRLSTVIGQRKQNLNNRPTVIPAPPYGHDNPGFLGQGDQPDPPMHSGNRLHRSKTQANGQHNNYNNNNILTQNRATNTTAFQPNGHLNTDMFSYNANLHDSQRNGNSNQRNTGSFQQVGQQNPNILIQTGQAEAGPHTVLINLNPLRQNPNATTQPHAVQVSLNAPQTSSGQNTRHYNDQQSNPVQQELVNTRHSNHSHVSGSHSNPQTWTDNVHNTAQPGHNSTLRNRQPRDHHVTNQTRSRRNTENTHPDSEVTPTPLDHTHTTVVDDSSSNTYPRQMPWDLMHGTPAYPNPQMDSYASQNSSESASEHSAPAPRPIRPPVDEQVRNISRASRRNFLRQFAHSAAQRRSRGDRDLSRQVTQPAQPRADYQSRTAPQNITSQRHDMGNVDRAVPHQPVPRQTAQPTHLISQAGPDQRQTGPLNAAPPNSHMLTQAALQQHTNQTPNPFVNWVQQTRTALQHPGAQSIPAQTNPARQTNQAGQVAPAPPPVLRLAEFKTLPREHIQKPRAVKPVQMMRRPVVMHHGRRPPNMPRHARAMLSNPHRPPVNPRMHAHVQGVPVHISQVHRRRRRP